MVPARHAAIATKVFAKHGLTVGATLAHTTGSIVDSAEATDGVAHGTVWVTSNGVFFRGLDGLRVKVG